MMENSSMRNRMEEYAYARRYTNQMICSNVARILAIMRESIRNLSYSVKNANIGTILAANLRNAIVAEVRF